MKVKFENWKNGRQIVVRNEKGQLVSRTRQKGSQIRTKAQATSKFKKDGTLSRFIKVLSKNNRQVENSKNLKISTKQGKVNINQQVEKAQFIGKNTSLLRTTKPIKNQKNYQYTARITWGNTQKTTLGYSKLVSKQGSQKEALQNAIKQAIAENIINYTYDISMVSAIEGIAKSQESNDVIIFKVEYKVYTYVRTN